MRRLPVSAAPPGGGLSGPRRGICRRAQDRPYPVAGRGPDDTGTGVRGVRCDHPRGYRDHRPAFDAAARGQSRRHRHRHAGEHARGLCRTRGGRACRGFGSRGAAGHRPDRGLLGCRRLCDLLGRAEAHLGKVVENLQ